METKGAYRSIKWEFSTHFIKRIQERCPDMNLEPYLSKIINKVLCLPEYKFKSREFDVTLLIKNLNLEIPCSFVCNRRLLIFKTFLNINWKAKKYTTEVLLIE